MKDLLFVMGGGLAGGVSGILGLLSSSAELRIAGYRLRRFETILLLSLGGMLACLLFSVMGHSSTLRSAGFFLLYLIFAFWQSHIDIREKLLPLEISLLGVAVGLLFIFFGGDPEVLKNCLWGGILGFLLLEGVYRAFPGMMGGGDPVFFWMVGVYAGARNIFLGLMVASLSALLVLILLRLLSDPRIFPGGVPFVTDSRPLLPFGPFLALGGFVCMMGDFS